MCKYCLQSTCPPGCPNYHQHKPLYYCSVCGNGIYEGEEYVANNDGEYIHFDCIQSIRQLLQWLGYEIKEMEDFSYYAE